MSRWGSLEVKYFFLRVCVCVCVFLCACECFFCVCLSGFKICWIEGGGCSDIVNIEFCRIQLLLDSSFA